ncbi:flavin-containing monooxygenase [Nocardioides limicola]|uniref:flavin-containing monooxygenase n=1 Tax=Nocardioides limicola TaxID=2803368 RepID=UPI00193B5166|nr:NAD(P)/FAD-dependent oxidoreductase [Nocardioides sp. DJM-14]
MRGDVEVAIIGAGISGIAAAIKLREAGITDIVVLEKADTYGGTWRANTYPGCACDVPSRLYSYSFAPSTDWSRVYSTQDEILDYIQGVARDHHLDDVTRFGVEVTDAEWDGKVWQLTTTDHGTASPQTAGQAATSQLTARYLVSAAGPWNEPKIPDIPGLADFAGPVWHSARWNHDHDLTGERVAVIGTGASAVQFVPRIQPDVAALHLFQRTAHWVLPKLDHPVPDVEKWALRTVPLLARTLKRLEYSMMELVGLAFHRPKPLMHALQRLGKAYLRAAVPDRELRATLTPHYLIGCKRILFSNDYLQTLGRPNVTVHATGVAEIRGNTVIGTDGSHAEVDTIILGTGFHILDMPVADRVRGADGRTLAEHWASSPEAYLGTVVAGFPNAFIVLGPGLGTGHTSAFAIAESQVSYLVDAIRHSQDTGQPLAVRPEVQAEYVAGVQAALGGTAYNLSQCSSYYIDANGRNSFSWPWSTGELVRRVSHFHPADYQETPA